MINILLNESHLQVLLSDIIISNLKPNIKELIYIRTIQRKSELVSLKLR